MAFCSGAGMCVAAMQSRKTNELTPAIAAVPMLQAKFQETKHGTFGALNA